MDAGRWLCLLSIDIIDNEICIEISDIVTEKFLKGTFNSFLSAERCSTYLTLRIRRSTIELHCRIGADRCSLTDVLMVIAIDLAEMRLAVQSLRRFN